MRLDGENLTIQLDPSIMEALRADAEAHGVDPIRVVEGLLERKYATNTIEFTISADEQMRWDLMSPAAQQAEIDDLAAAFADMDAGRLFSQEEVTSRVMATIDSLSQPQYAHSI